MRRGSLEQQMSNLPSLARAELTQLYARQWKQAAAGQWSDEQLRLAVGYQLQARLIARLRLKAMDAIQASEAIVSSLSRDSRHRELVRRWKSRVVTVSLVDGRAIYQGTTYGSLSAVGEIITGSRRVGEQLFGIQSSGGHDGKGRR